MTASESAAAAVLRNGKNVKAKKSDTKPKPKGEKAKVDPIIDLRNRARKWADLHANPKTRSKMDDVLAGLTTDDQRLVMLDGQRIAAGLPPKHLTRKEQAA